MANLTPPTLPDWVRNDHKRSAECTMYDRLGQTLSDGYSVFYSATWLSKVGRCFVSFFLAMVREKMPGLWAGY